MTEYPQYVNGRQSKHERHVKYHFLKYSGIPYDMRKRMMDWTINHIVQFLDAHRTKPERLKAIEHIKSVRKHYDK